MDPQLDYQQIINAVAQLVVVALPIGMIFGITEKLVNTFLSFAFGKEKINL